MAELQLQCYVLKKIYQCFHHKATDTEYQQLFTMSHVSNVDYYLETYSAFCALFGQATYTRVPVTKQRHTCDLYGYEDRSKPNTLCHQAV